MLKLYKRDGEQVHYWEAWSGGWLPRRGEVLIVHWGVVGETGRANKPRIKAGQSVEAAINSAAKKFRKAGYAELSMDEHAMVVVQYRTKGWGSEKDLEKRHKIEDILNECLGWTGNGCGDGGDIGSGTINIFSAVVNAEKARDAIVAALKERRLLKGAVVAARKNNEDEDYDVLWPKNFKGKFSIM